MAKASGGMKEDRYHELRAMLMERRREVAGEVRRKIHESRDQSIRRRQNSESALDVLESSDFGVQEDIELALIQMKADTLTRIDQALDRLVQGTYGYCFDCGGEISEQRLRALPFAVCCKGCEEAREVAEQRERSRRRGFGLFADVGPQFDS